MLLSWVSSRGICINKRSKLFGCWQKRYFVLSQCKLSYFKSSLDDLPWGSFNLTKVKLTVVKNSKDPLKFSFFVEGIKREFKLKAETAESCKRWWGEINKHLHEAKKANAYDSNILKIKMFWRKQEQISSEDFVANANSGDILLFRGK